ncbi:MAG: glycosyltransferase [Ilumatobacter fluminis]
MVDDDVKRLRDDGVEIETYERDSDEIAEFSIARKVELPLRPTYSYEDAKRFRAVLERFGPDVVHIHNVFPLISPAIIPLAKQAGAATVQTVHNYRHVCPAGTLFRDGRPCEQCVTTRTAWPAVVHGCYRDSRAASVSMSLSRTLSARRWDAIDRFLAVSEVVAERLRDFGVPKERIAIHPNVLADPGEPPALGHNVAYIGRLCNEKGTSVLLDAWSNSHQRKKRKLHIAGGGPLEQLVRAAADADPSVVFHGLVPEHKIDELLADAALVVAPSVWLDPDPLSAIRALALGRPLVASNRGAFPSYVNDTNGWLTVPEPAALAKAIDAAFESRPELERRSAGARQTYLQGRTPSRHRLIDVYSSLAT